MPTKKDLTGMKFGYLTVINEYGKNRTNHITWKCICKCGNITTTPTTNQLLSGKTQSCGCRQREILKNMRKTHGDSRTKLYRQWRDMKNRCYNSHDRYYSIYGGRGIVVCDEWMNDYACFKEWAINNGYNDTLTIDRIDTNGNYEPSNCKWSTQYEQANNRRNNRIVTYHGETDTLTNMCRKLNINYSTIKVRIKRFGISFEEAVDNYKNSPFIEYWKK